MRTTLDIEEPVLQVLKELARREGRTAGAIASDLIRRGLSQSAVTGVQEAPARNGFRPFASASTDPPVTNEQVDRLRDDLGV